MAAAKSESLPLKYLLPVFLLVLTMSSATAARILAEEEAPAASGAGPVVPAAGAGPIVPPSGAGPVVPAAGAGPLVPAAGAGPLVPGIGAGAANPAIGAVPGIGAGPVDPVDEGKPEAPVEEDAEPEVPGAGAAGAALPGGAAGVGGVAPGGIGAGGVAPGGIGAGGVAPGAASNAAANDPHHPLIFFMHDIIGGSNPSARAVTGIVSNQAVSGSIAFAKPNGANLPLNNGGVPVGDTDNGYINNNNVPLLTGLSGTTANTVQSENGGTGLNGFSAVSGGELPAGAAVQKLMFGTLTVMDDELTEGHSRGSGLIGKAQGFYVASSVEGTSQMMAFTAMFQSGGFKDSISFFGVHRTAVAESQLAIMGGTGKYLNAKGFAIMRTFHSANKKETDGVETLVELAVYLA